MTGVAAAVTSDPLPPLEGRRSGLAPGLCRVVSRCLEKSRDERFQTVADLAEALRPFAAAASQLSIDRVLGTLAPKSLRLAPGSKDAGERSGAPATATTLRTGDSDRAEPPPRRRRWWVAAGVVVGLVVAVVVGSGWVPGPASAPSGRAAAAVVDAQQAAAALPLAPPARSPVEAPPRKLEAESNHPPESEVASARQPSARPASAVRARPRPKVTAARVAAAAPVRGAEPLDASASPVHPAAPTDPGVATVAVQGASGGIIDQTVDTRH